MFTRAFEIPLTIDRSTRCSPSIHLVMPPYSVHPIGHLMFACATFVDPMFTCTTFVPLILTCTTLVPLMFTCTTCVHPISTCTTFVNTMFTCATFIHLMFSRTTLVNPMFTCASFIHLIFTCTTFVPLMFSRTTLVHPTFTCADVCSPARVLPRTRRAPGGDALWRRLAAHQGLPSSRSIPWLLRGRPKRSVADR